MNKQHLMKKTISLLLCITLGSAFAQEQAAVQSAEQENPSSLFETVFHVNPSQVKQVFADYKALHKAAAVPAPNHGQIQRSVKRVNLSTGQQPPLLHVVKGYIANIQFVGENGQPWPITKAVSGDQENLVVEGGGKANPLNLTLHAVNSFVATNVAVYLAGRSMPIMLYTQNEEDTSAGIDAMLTYLLDGYPPGTSAPEIANQRSVSDALLNALDAYPGETWAAVSVNNTASPFGIKLWTRTEGKSILRLSQGQLISPNWDTSVVNGDGTVTAYQFSHTPLLFVISDKRGHTYQVSVTDPTQALTNTIMNTNQTVMHAAVREF